MKVVGVDFLTEGWTSDCRRGLHTVYLHRGSRQKVSRVPGRWNLGIATHPSRWSLAVYLDIGVVLGDVGIVGRAREVRPPRETPPFPSAMTALDSCH